MKNIYILTEHGKTWSRAGLDWIEEVMKPSFHETDETTACMGLLYNSPGLLLKELTEHPDSYVIISYEQIFVIADEDIPEFCAILKANIDNEDYTSCWEVAMKFMKILMDRMNAEGVGEN